MVVESLASYGKANNTMTGSRLPDWIHEETINFPPHQRRTKLVEEYKVARLKHCESIEILQFATTTSQLTDSQKVVEIEACQRRVELAKQELQQAEEQLWDFNHHTPQQRAELIELQVAELEAELLKVRVLEQEYVSRLVNDPDANKRRLERLVFGHTGLQAEYSAEQLSQLRSFRDRVQSIEGRIVNFQRDIERIRELVAQEQRKAQIQMAMDVVLPKFNDACTRFNDAWAELQSAAAEHSIAISHNLQIPSEATFKQSNNPYEGNSTINLLFTPK